jgi:two-component system, chemotaxis family, response regulator Rcp1
MLLEGANAEILLVEDNPGDVRLTAEALKFADVSNHLHTVSDGTEAMAFLRRTGEHTGAIRPDLILLDLNLPKKNGCDVLKEIKSDDDLKMIPVIVLTTSSSEDDMRKCYELQANSFVSKPMDFDQFVDVMKGVENFWIRLARPPSSS